MDVPKTLVNHRSPPLITAKISTFVSLHFHQYRPFCSISSIKPKSKQFHSVSLSTRIPNNQICFSTSSSSINEPSKPSSKESSSRPGEDSNEEEGKKPSAFVDEWGEKSEPEPETITKFTDPDPPGKEADNDEWGGDDLVERVGFGNGTPGVDDAAEESERLEGLKRALVDTVYGSELGYRASAEVRAEALELVAQLEAANPTPAPTERPDLLDGNWVLVYTAFSELLPLLATGSLPLVKVEKICQSIDSSSLIIENSTTISSPVAAFSFSASAAFEVRTPSRIDVEFKEGSFKPPEIKTNIELPQNVDIFGQSINLSPVQNSLNPLQNAVAGIARTISGQPPLKIPIPGERSKSWLLITYLDKDLRISRGDGGLFVLAKEGSALLEQ